MMFYRGAESFGRCFWDGGANFFHSGGGFIMMGLGLLFVALIVLAIVLIVKKAGHHHQMQESNEALDILNERFAKSEVTEEEYKKMKDILRRR